MSDTKNVLATSLVMPLGFVALLWLILGVEWLLPVSFKSFGIYPREIFGLWGILSAPLIHGDSAHLANNSSPLIIMGATILLSYRPVAYKVFFWVWLASGLGIWLVARPAFHIGASGLIYGFVCFLFFSGVFRRDVKSLAIAMLVTFIYGGMVWGVLPQQDAGISWEAHLLGALSGAVCAYAFRRKTPKQKYEWEDEPDEAPTDNNFEYWNYRK